MTDDYIQRIREAASRGTPLCIRGGGTKDFYGGPIEGEVLDTRLLSGIVAYEPSELYLTARAGTPLAQIEALLDQHGQMLPFEPPHFGAGATLGGAIASGLAGPRRASIGALRDFVLGVVMIDGQGERLTFGGQVMKNVAGFDVSRLMCGAMGTLGLLVEISIRVLPRPAVETTLRLELPVQRAVEQFNRWAGQPLPISATSAHGGLAHVRLSGGHKAVSAAIAIIGGEVVDQAAAHWRAVREQDSAFFKQTEGDLWRVSVPPTALVFSGDQLVEWGGALRWWHISATTEVVRALASALGGQATRFRGGSREEVFAPLDAVNLKIQKRLKAAFDPAGIFNRGRLCFL